MSAVVLVTRPFEQARAFAAEIIPLGALPVIQPLLDIEYISLDFETISKPDAVIVTSLHAVKGRIFPVGWQDVPVYCVGEKTAESARISGAQMCVCGEGGVESLLPLIRLDIPRGSHILYLCGNHVTCDMTEALHDYKVEAVIGYRASAVDTFQPDILAVFPEIVYITLFSARTGRILSDLMNKNHLNPYAKNIKLLCLSSSVLESVQEIGWKSCHVAEHPTQTSMIEKLKCLVQG